MAPTVERRSLRPAWLAPAGVGLLAAVATGMLARLDPAWRASVTPGCPFRALTGLDCPGCGGTRAVYALTQGDVGLALEHNLLTVAVLLPLLAWAWGAWLSATIGWRDARPSLAPRVSMLLAGGMLVFFVVRNLPWWPLSWLGSTAG